ncbi:MAG: AI-2E family transporter [Rhodospirillaceae bacterium]|nr:AI-2E family transporter [Rhodospirillaceae bacterium]HAA93466.1 AI-2E family transporter [Rhodospirillaceae bacterium]
MTFQQRSLIWIAVIGVFIVALVLLRGILLPFVIGMAVAYLLDPVCDWLENHRFSRTWATVLVTLLFFVLIVLAFALLIPLLINQVAEFVDKVPGYVRALEAKIMPLAAKLMAHLDVGSDQEIKELFSQHIGDAAAIAGRFVIRLLSGLEAAFNVISIIAITPVVAFYLLRDWDRIINQIDGYLPISQRDTIREQAGLVDQTLSGFVRGQFTVCLLLGIYYAIGLSVIGLDFGLILGLGTGLISFVPYFGMLAGVVVGLGIAIAQFDTYGPIVAVGAVFAVGQIVEGNFVTPKLVGDRVGLHAVWIIFALMAGGALFGFLGVLLAVPIASVIGVMVRFALDRYLASPLYDGSRRTGGRKRKGR